MRLHEFHLRRVAAAALAAMGLVVVTGAWASADLAVSDATSTGTRTRSVTFTVSRSGDTGFPVSVQFATADGTAKAGADYTASSGTLSFAVGETSKSVTVAVLRKIVLRDRSFTLNLSNAAAGTAPAVAFGGAGLVPVGYHTEGVAVADFNGDGKLDFATVGYSSQFGIGTSVLHVLRNDSVDGGPAANFSEAFTAPAATFFARVSAADLNRDGKPDLYVPGFGGGGDVLYINATPAGATTFSFVASAVSAAGTTGSFMVGYGDFDGDGMVDVAGVDGGLGIVAVLRNTTPVGATTPALTRVASLQADSYPSGVVVADFNGDGKPDIAVANSGSNTLSLFVNTTVAGGPIGFGPAVPTAISGGPTSLVTADFNGDGKPDLATANNQPSQSGQTFSILINTTPTGSTTPSFSVANAFGGAPYGVAAADMNGDGKPDLLIANLFADQDANGAIDVYLNNTPTGATTPSFALTARRPAGDEPHWAGIGDFNRDGRVDFIGADAYSSNAGAEFGIKPVTNPQVKIVDASGTGTIARREP